MAEPAEADGPNVRKVLIWAVLVVTGIASALLSMSWARSLSEDEDVAMQWSDAIQRLGIEPIYPPQEDIGVGDISLVVTSDRLHLDRPPMFDGRLNSIKLWRLNLSNELNQYYNYMPRFPDTLDPPADPKQVWKQQNAEGPIFAPTLDRRSLPIVLFPEFSLAKVRQASNGLSIQGGPLSWLFGGGAESERTIELRIPAAETYGVPAVTANVRLSDFCTDAKSKRFCGQKEARRQLASIAGKGIFACMPGRKDGEPRRFRYEVQIYLTSRVYLIRSIETVVASGSVFRQQAAAKPPDISGGAAKDEPAQTDPPKGDATTGDAAPAKPDVADSSAKSLAESKKAKFAKYADRALGFAPGSSVSVASADSRRVAITKTLQRPVAIGFRAFKAGLHEDATCSDP